jgi:TetR/AcrR family transcriptional regulator, fatty acid metabolism regulator protein
MRRKEGNKDEAILDAAVKIFAQHGYHNAKITAIAEEAGVATGSVYLYYKNKEGIVLAIFDRIWVRLSDGLNATAKRTDISPTQKLDAVIDLMFDLFIANPALAAVFVNEQHHLIQNRKGNVSKQFDHFLDVAEEIIRDGVRKKQFNPGLDLKLFRNFIVGGMRSLLRQWSLQPSVYPLNRIRQNIKFFIKNGVLLHER